MTTGVARRVDNTSGTSAAAIREETGEVMIRYSTQPRRLRVSALAAVANPSYARVDTWNLLDDACRQLAEVRPRRAGQGPRSGAGETPDGPPRRLRAVLALPGAANLAIFRAHLDEPVHGAAHRGGLAGRAAAVVNTATAQRFSTRPRRWPTRSWSPRPSSSSSTPCCSPTTPRPPRRTAWPNACGRCATRPTTCSSKSWWFPASRTPSPRSR